MERQVTDEYKNNFGEEYYETLPTLANSMVETLNLFGCKRIYGVGGDFAANLIKGLAPHFKVLPSSNEMHASFSACGQAEIDGIGFCLTTYTVGSLPCMSAAALAKAERLPVIFLSGAPGEFEVSGGAIHHTVSSSHSWDVKFDAALDAFSKLGIRSSRLQGTRSEYQPSNAGEEFLKLVRYAYTHKEPVFIEIPRDLVFTKVQALTLSPELLKLKHPTFLSGSKIISENIFSKLQTSKKPLVFLGERIKFNAELRNLILKFCENHEIPFATNIFAKGLLPENHSLSLGAYNGAFSPDSTRRYIEKDVDYILEIGTSICVQDTSSAFSTGSYKIDSFSNKTVLKGTDYNCEDVLNVIKNLVEFKLERFQYSNPSDGGAVKTIDEKAELSFSNLVLALNEYQRKETESFIYLPEIGNSFFASFNLETKDSDVKRSWISNPWYAAMGTSLPYARALCHSLEDLGSTNVPFIITGDGGFHFQLNELIHFMKDQLFVVIILMRNNIFHLGKQGDDPIYHCNDENFNYTSLINAYGGQTHLVKSVGGFYDGLGQIMESKKGIHLFEVWAPTDSESSSPEIKLLNLYISAKSGDKTAISSWEKLK